MEIDARQFMFIKLKYDPKMLLILILNVIQGANFLADSESLSGQLDKHIILLPICRKQAPQLMVKSHDEN